ncbi:hypothetical protein PspLS_03452 [Pyricularia sp. CBS 133598]|nr:hypothetical protein PspLS_03452 [Pyricularia sp. CBS 133598]
MSKEDTEPAPPPYSESAHPTTTTIPSRSPGQTPPSPSSLLSSHLATHLSSLSARLRQTQSARATRQALLDLELVERIVPHVEAFLADVVDAPSRPAAELTIVPAPAVPPAWALSGAAERRREGELVHLVRLAVPGASPARAAVDEKGRPRDLPQSSDSKGGSSGVGDATSPSTGSSLRPERDWTSMQFDEWGRWDEDAEAAAMAAAGGNAGGSPSWWWRDERMAERLAAHLQPRPPVKTERRGIQAAVVQAKEEKKSGWGLWRKKSSSSTATPASPVAAAVSPVSPVLEQDDGVKMIVRADEVTFRRENDFGVWESMSGWGIVVTFAVR